MEAVDVVACEERKLKVKQCQPVWGSCNLPSGHKGQHSQDGPFAAAPAPVTEPSTVSERATCRHKSNLAILRARAGDIATWLPNLALTLRTVPVPITEGNIRRMAENLQDAIDCVEGTGRYQGADVGIACPEAAPVTEPQEPPFEIGEGVIYYGGGGEACFVDEVQATPIGWIVTASYSGGGSVVAAASAFKSDAPTQADSLEREVRVLREIKEKFLDALEVDNAAAGLKEIARLQRTERLI